MTVGGTAPLERTVVITGPLTCCVVAQRMLDVRVRARLENDGIHREVLRIVVPNEFVRHLIGKSGSNISSLQTQTGIRIQVQAEASMQPAQIGRAVTFQGPEQGRALAQYLVARQIAEGPYQEWPASSSSPKTNVQSISTTSSPSNGSIAFGTSLDYGANTLFDDYLRYTHVSPALGTMGTLNFKRRDSFGALPRTAISATTPPSTPASPSKSTLMSKSSSSSSLPQSPSFCSVPSPSTSPRRSLGSPTPASQSPKLPLLYMASFFDDDCGSSYTESVIAQVNVPNSALAHVFGANVNIFEMEQRYNVKFTIEQGSSSQSRLVTLRGLPYAVRRTQQYIQSRIDSYFMHPPTDPDVLAV